MLNELIEGRYKVEREVGRGGMGVVLRAYDTRLNRLVALKMLPSNTTHDSELRHRLAAEARAASALSHPGIATVYDFVEQGEGSFIVYEYVEGRTWSQRAGSGPLHHGRNPRCQCPTRRRLGRGAQSRDCPSGPQTRKYVRAGRLFPRAVKILDFGLAKHLHAPLSFEEENAAETVSIATSQGLLVGTVNYMAPEQLEGQPVDARTDIYALGL